MSSRRVQRSKPKASRSSLSRKRVTKKKTPTKKARAYLGETRTPKHGKGRLNTWAKGNPGKPKGAKDHIPRGVKASLKQLLEEIAENEQATLRNAVMRGLQRGGPKHADRYLRLVAEYVDGKPADTLNLNAGFKQETLEQSADILAKKMERMVTAVLAKRAKTE